MLVNVLCLVALINQEDGAVIVHMTDAPADNLVYFSYCCYLVPVVPHDSQGRQMLAGLRLRSVLNLVIAFQTVIQVSFLQIDSCVVY